MKVSKSLTSRYLKPSTALTKLTILRRRKDLNKKINHSLSLANCFMDQDQRRDGRMPSTMRIELFRYAKKVTYGRTR